MFAFRHRCFLVKRGTEIPDLKALGGKRVGMDGWPNSGNTWTRVTLRQAGVDIWKIDWVIAPVEGAPRMPGTARRRRTRRRTSWGGRPASRWWTCCWPVRSTCWWRRSCRAASSRRKPDRADGPGLRAAERAYYKEHGYIPAHHLVKLHREVVERDPWIVKSLMNAFTESKRLWVERRRRKLADTTPWLLAGSRGDGRDLRG